MPDLSRFRSQPGVDMGRTFDAIESHGIRTEASGGLVEISYKPYRMDRQHFIGMVPSIAREVAAAMLAAAEAIDRAALAKTES